MLAVLRSIATDEITAVQRTALNHDGTKRGRRMLGVAAGAAIKFDGDDAVTAGLIIGEGAETVLSGRQIGFRPAWALGSVGTIASFAVLPGIEALSIHAEHDKTGANARAIEECGNRWQDAGCIVLTIAPRIGGDLNDALRARVGR
jgi:putative DNA primase/helicase